VGDPPDPAHFEKELRKSLIQYITQHPQAMDTAEGIATWWTKVEGSQDVEAVRRALEQLADEGLFERVGSGRSAHYRSRKYGVPRPIK